MGFHAPSFSFLRVCIKFHDILPYSWVQENIVIAKTELFNQEEGNGAATGLEAYFLDFQFSILKRITHHFSVPPVILGMLYKWNEMVCNLFVLAFLLRIMPQRSIKVSKCVIVCFLFIAEWYSIVCRSHNLFIHSTIEWHLGCF